MRQRRLPRQRPVQPVPQLQQMLEQRHLLEIGLLLNHRVRLSYLLSRVGLAGGRLFNRRPDRMRWRRVRRLHPMLGPGFLRSRLGRRGLRRSAIAARSL